MSRECDLVIFSSETSPKFFFDKDLDVRFFPKNEVYSTFEIKSTLNEKELNDAIDKIHSVKTISSHRSQWLFGDNEWQDQDVKLAEYEEEEKYWGRSKKRYVNNEDYKDYKLKTKKTIEIYSETFCGIFAYKGGRKLSLDSLRSILIKLDNPPDIVVVLNKGLLIKVDDFTIRRLRSIIEKKAHYHINDFDIFVQKIQMVGLERRFEYLVLENNDEKVNLMYFYIFLIDFLNEFKKCPDSYTSDIISVWKQG